MTDLIYLAVVIIVALGSIISGFRKGITRQTGSLLGLAFGSVAARVLVPEFISSFQWTSAFSPSPEFNDFSANLVCAITIYGIVFLIFYAMSPIFRSLMRVFGMGILNRLTGAFFALVRNLLWLSIFFNLMICFNPRSGLLKYERANDGNLMAAVMEITPVFLGCYGAEDFAHFNQLKEAKTISCNFNSIENVILTQA